MSSVFISYRRDDSATVSGRIYDRLVARYGRPSVFKDVDSIPLGVDFKQYIAGVIQRCAVQLVVIGPRWLSVSDGSGQRRLDDAADFVRLEIESALQRGIPVIPLLVEGAEMPPADQLPDSLLDLTTRNGVPVRNDPDFDHDMARVMSALDRWVAPLRAAAPQQWPAATASPAPQRTLPTTPTPAPSLPPAGMAPPRRSAAPVVWITVSVVTAIALTVGAVAVVLNLPTTSSSGTPMNALVGVAASSGGGDVWVWDSEGAVYYYGKNRWAQVPGTGLDAAMIRAIAVVPGTHNAVAVGASGAILKLTGSNATKIESGTNRDLSDVSLDSATDGWAVSDILVHLHSDGTNWSAQTQPVDSGQKMDSVSTVSATEVWAGGSVGGTAALMHFDGTGWSDVATPTDYYSPYGVYGFSSISAPASVEVWAVAGFDSNYIFHYHNGTWDQPYAVFNPDQYDVGSLAVTLNSIRMTSTSEGWAVGSYEPNGASTPFMLHYTGGRWSQVTNLPSISSEAELTDCAMASATDGWVVGKTEYTHYSASLVLHESGGTWIKVVQG